MSFFGTNLLTQCPVPVAVFCLFFTSREINIKQSPIDLKLHGTYFWKESNPGDLESTSRKQQGSHEAGGAPPPCLVYFLLLYIPIYPKTIGEHNRSGVPPPEASVATESQSRPVPAPCRRGGIISVAIFIIPAATTMRRE